MCVCVCVCVCVYFQLIVLVYKDEQQKLQITLCKKNTDKQSYLHAKSNHSVSLKKSIPSCQMLRVKRICSTNSEFECNCKDCKSNLQKEVMTHLSLKPKLRRLNF